jgi:hypothetical protein
MIIVTEKRVNEAQFKFDTVKSLQISGTKARITIEIDLARTAKDVAYDSLRYGLEQDQFGHKYLAGVISRELDWKAYALATNGDHELARILSDGRKNDYL